MQYGKRPVVKKFRRKVTGRGRDIRVTTLERKERKRPMRQRRNMRKQRTVR